MESIWLIVAYVVVLVGLVYLGLMKIGDIWAQRRDRKYYQMVKEDAAFWQMKIEQSGMNIMDFMELTGKPATKILFDDEDLDDDIII